MTQSLLHGEVRGALARAGMTADDLAWLDGIGWSDAAVGPVENEAIAADYARREDALNASISGLLATDRGLRLEAKLAAAIGAALANWRERDDDE